MKMSKLTLSIVAVVMLASFAAFATADDLAIKTAVEKKLDHKDIANGNGPWVEVDKGTVTLSGKVRSVWAKNESIKRAMKIKGVVAVQDELEIAFGESDKKVAEEVRKKVLGHPSFTVYDDVRLAVDKGHVALAGRVTMPYKANEIEERASKVLGVQSVTNEIETLPLNIGDERLRWTLTRRIYGNSMFMEYAHHVNPPIHIIVERGHVTLTGAVRSKVEKAKAEHLARGTLGVFSVKNELQVSS
jgi:osmotically-inducible protein OsmY